VDAVILRDERGFTLPELLLVMIIALIILGATLTVFNRTYQTAHDHDDRFDSIEIARNALDLEARQLRNLARRLNNTPVIDTVNSYDLIFQTSDPQRTWVRYCLDTTGTGASTARGKLWGTSLALPANSASYSVTAGMRGACPGTGWTKAQVVADYVTNRVGGVDRPIFSYACADGTTTTCIASPAAYDQIVNVTAQTIIDTTPNRDPKELLVSSGVYLRNQNQAPVASFVATSTLPRTVLLNGSGSTDYEGRSLSYWWFKGTMPTQIECDAPTITVNAAEQRILWGGVLIGEGITLSHTFPDSEPSGTLQRIGLVACDPGDRYGTAGVPPAAYIRVTVPN
jgi:prepilin-type N-terminal cleavage/methylation domain-containing protein